MTNEIEDWKEKKFQEKLLQLFNLVNMDFYDYIYENSEGRGLRDLKDERLISIKSEYPSAFGEGGSRPDIFLETNKGNCFVFELKPDASFSEEQLLNHDTNLKKWCDENNRHYISTILIANLDSEQDEIAFTEKTIKWIGWDIIYRALEDLKINKLDPDIRTNIDKIFQEVPLAKLSTVLKQSLLGEGEGSELFYALKLSVVVSELKEQLYSQMNLDELLRKFEPITGNENHKIFSDKANILFKSVEKSFRKEFESNEYVIKIETGDYSANLTSHLTDWTGAIEVDFRALKNNSEDRIDVVLRLRSGKKISLLKILVNLYDESRTVFDELIQSLINEGADVYAQFGSAEKIDITVKEGMDQVRERIFMPVYIKKSIPVFNKERDAINNSIIETAMTYLRSFKILMDKLKTTTTSEEIAKDIEDADTNEELS